MIPSPESPSAKIATWLVSDGDYVEKDQAIAEVDSDKATGNFPPKRPVIRSRQRRTPSKWARCVLD